MVTNTTPGFIARVIEQLNQDKALEAEFAQ